MRRSGILLFVGALLVLCAGATVAAAPGADGVARVAEHRSASTEQSSDDTARPQVVASRLLQRAVTVAAGVQRRSGPPGPKVLLLGAFTVLLAMRTVAGRLDDEANTRLLRVSNTPCAQRGPPFTS